MYEITLTIHNILRWIVLILAVVTIVRALIGWLGKRNWEALDDNLGKYYTISLDIQLLVGLLLYFVLSPITRAAFSNIGEAMGNSDLRFFLVEHFLMMLIALIVAHIGRSRTKKVEGDISKFKNAFIFYGISLVLILAAIPWWRPLLRF